MWISATSRKKITTAYAEAAEGVTGEKSTDADQAAARFLAWLRTAKRPWLIILDDLSRPDQLRDLWPPAALAGRTVVTTQRRDAALLEGRKEVPVGLFTTAEAAQYLADKFEHRPDLAVGAGGLAAALGYLPLAMAQASAFILDREITCAEYCVRLANQRTRLSEVFPESSSLPDGQELAVAATWAVSMELADELRPKGLALPTLQIAAQLDPSGIPQSLFSNATVLKYLRSRTHTTRPVTEADVHDTLNNLQRLSLVSGISGWVLGHPLLWRIVREEVAAEQRSRLGNVADRALFSEIRQRYSSVGLFPLDFLELPLNVITYTMIRNERKRRNGV